ncbi:MAG: hypothetical protein QOF51_2140, partial [Chloroflexota bacterium]|nr:hypothetical protein [Chloroflexota bacterium]
MHKLLARQLQRYLGSPDIPPDDWASFVAAIDSAYEQADGDRLRLERSLDLASEELMDRFQQLQADVVERQGTAKELERSLSLLRATLDSTTDGIIVVDRAGRVVDYNQKYVDMWGIPEETIASRDHDAILALVRDQIRDSEGFIAAIKQLRADPFTESDDVLELTDGRIVERHSQPQWVADESVGRVWSFRDITAERRRAEDALRQSEEQLRQSQKMEAIGQLAGGVAHDFNNLLTAINGFSELVLVRMEVDDPLRPFVQEIAKAGERAHALTGQLLAFGRRQVLQPEVLSMSAIVADMATLLQRIIGEDVELTTAVAPDLGVVRADPGQLGQVILNLATNARDAMPKGGQLTIEAANVQVDSHRSKNPSALRPGRYIALRVSDTGLGIDAETLPHIFEPFFTTKEVGKGS